MNPVIDDFMSNEYRDTHERLLQKYPVSALEPAVCAYYLANHFDLDLTEFIKLLATTSDTSSAVDALNFAFKVARQDEISFESGLTGSICTFQYAAQVERFRRTKQVYTFDKDFLTELLDTDPNVTITGDLLKTAPHKVMYLDYSANTEICEQLQLDGTLVTILDIEVGDDVYWMLFCTAYYRGKSMFMHELIMPNSNEPTSVAEIINTSKITYNNVDSEKRGQDIILTLLQSLIYLCSFEPDVRETPMSKQRYKAAKANKPKDKRIKHDMPEHEYMVGEYFGAAFRKFTYENVGKQHKSTGTGSAKRPHMRRAHWHGYWRGKKGSENRTLVRRWVHESFINVDYDTGEKKLSVTKHKVK